MEYEWKETPAGNWRLVDRRNGYSGPMAIAIAHRTAGKGDWFAGIIFSNRISQLNDNTHDIVFQAEYPLEEMKALIETTVALRSDDGV